MIKQSSSSLMLMNFDSACKRLTLPRRPTLVHVRFVKPRQQARVWPYVAKTLQLAVVLTIATGGAWLFSLSRTHQLFTIISGSMEPTIHTGSVVAVGRSQTNYNTGDIISFHSSHGTTTHRIAEVVSSSGSTQYRMKGDANTASDIELVPADHIIGKVSAIIPYLGYILVWLKTKPGFSFIILLPATLVILQETVAMKRAWRQLRRPLAFAPAIAALFLISLTLRPSDAFLSDATTITNNSISTADVFPTISPSPLPSPTVSPTPSISPTPQPTPCTSDVTVDQSNTNTGDGSTNNNSTDVHQTCNTTTNNNTTISNDITVKGDTGSNTSSNNTNAGNQSSGDVTTNFTIINH